MTEPQKTDAELIAELPLLVRDIVERSNWRGQLRKIVTERHLRVDQGAFLEAAVLRFITGNQSAEEMAAGVMGELKLDPKNLRAKGGDEREAPGGGAEREAPPAGAPRRGRRPETAPGTPPTDDSGSFHSGNQGWASARRPRGDDQRRRRFARRSCKACRRRGAAPSYAGGSCGVGRGGRRP